MKPSRGLGRGLDALIDHTGTDEERVVSLPVLDIDPNASQPRKRFDASALEELAASITAVGVISPVLVTQNGRRYTLLAGERRWRAARIAGLTHIPAIVRDLDTIARMEIALIENLQRQDLTPVEEALALRALMEECGLTQEGVSTRVGRSRPAVANLLRLLTLPRPVLDLIEEGRLSAGHGRALVGLSDAEAQLQLARKCVAGAWSVRQMEQAVEAMRNASADPPAPRDLPPPEFNDFIDAAREVFGTRVQLRGTLTQGKIELAYATRDELEHIYDLVLSLRGKR